MQATTSQAGPCASVRPRMLNVCRYWTRITWSLGAFLVDLPALGPLQGVPLPIDGLILGRDAGVADAHGANPKNSGRL